MQEIQIQTQPIGLNQLLKYAGLCGSGAEARAAIEAGRVKVNGTLERRIRKKIGSGDHIEFDAVGYKVVLNQGH